MATEPDGRIPRAIIHKRILDEASARPDASLEALAGEITGVSVDLVERVLDEYGDPIEESVSSSEGVDTKTDPSEAQESAPEPTSEATSLSAGEVLSAEQRETLRQINEEPTATQREIGEALDVSGSTISNRLRDIAGFAWQDRQEFVSRFFGTPLIGDGLGQIEEEVPAEVVPRLEQLENRLSAIESNFDSSPLPSELAHKVLHTCMKSDGMSEEEELELIRALFD